MTKRDLVGYGEHPPDPKQPGGARLALSFVLNYEEGGERTPLEGDPESAFPHEVVGAPPTAGRRNLNTESMFEYGSRAGFWRVYRIFQAHGLPLTVYAVGQALEGNPPPRERWSRQAGKWRATAGAGLTIWTCPSRTSAPTCDTRSRRSSGLGQRPVGWYTGRVSEATRRLVVEEGGFLYDSDSYADELPYWVEVTGRRHLVIPYTLDANDFKFLIPNGFVTASDFHDYLVDSFEHLYEEGGRMMSVGLHCRIVGRPGRAAGLDRFLAHVKARDGVWVTTRAEIARHWHEHHVPA